MALCSLYLGYCMFNQQVGTYVSERKTEVLSCFHTSTKDMYIYITHTPLPCRTMETVVVLHEPLQLRLNIFDLFARKLVFCQCNTCSPFEKNIEVIVFKVKELETGHESGKEEG